RGGDVIEHLWSDRPCQFLTRLGRWCRLGQLIARLRQTQALPDELVEARLALEQVVERRQEVSGLRPLNDPVVISAGDGHDLADPEFTQPLLGHHGELDRVADRPNRDDAALAYHESRHRGYRAETAGIGERHG